MRPFNYYKVASVAQAVFLSKHQRLPFWPEVLTFGHDEGPHRRAEAQDAGFFIDIKGIKEPNHTRRRKTV